MIVLPDRQNRGMVVALPSCLPASPFICLSSWSAAALSPFICPPFMISILACCWVRQPPCLSSFVTLCSLSFVSQCWFLCPPPPASPFIAFHLVSNFFGNAIWGLCRCNWMFCASLQAFLSHIVDLYPWKIAPQIAGSYRGSYFSKIGLLIPTIAKWSWCRCRLVSCLFLISILGCSWLPLPPWLFVSLHDRFSRLLLAAGAALSPFICLPAWSPFWPALGCRCRLVSLHVFPFICLFWAALGSPCRLVALHLSTCMISIVACSWLPLPPCLPSFVSLHDLHSLLWATAAALSPFIVSLRNLHSGLLLAAPAALSHHLSPFLISILGCSWLPLPPCLPSFVSLHISIRLSLCMISVLGCSWLPLPPLSLHLSCHALEPFICLPVWVPVSASSGLALRSLSFFSQLFRGGSMPV